MSSPLCLTLTPLWGTVWGATVTTMPPHVTLRLPCIICNLSQHIVIPILVVITYFIKQYHSLFVCLWTHI